MYVCIYKQDNVANLFKGEIEIFNKISFLIVTPGWLSAYALPSSLF